MHSRMSDQEMAKTLNSRQGKVAMGSNAEASGERSLNLNACLALHERRAASVSSTQKSDDIGRARADVRADPRSENALQRLAVVLHKYGDRLEALQVIERARSLSPRNATLFYNYAVILQSAGLTGPAMAIYQRCLDVDPDYRDALWNYGELLRLEEEFEAALACFDRLLALEGKMRPDMAHRMAVCCDYLGLDSRAAALFEKQIAVSDYVLSHWEYSHLLLRQGKLEQAWPHFAFRFAAGVVKVDVPPYPRWDGRYARDTVLLITGEQGAGDEILFSSFLNSIVVRARESGMRVIFACRAELQRLFRASFASDFAMNYESELSGFIKIIGHRHDLADEVDRTLKRMQVAGSDAKICWISLGDLPLYGARTEVPNWIKPDPDDVVLVRRSLGERRGARIGLVWRSNPAALAAARVGRSVPSHLMASWLETVRSRINMQTAQAGVEFYGLQHAEHAPETAVLVQHGLKDMSESLTNFSRTAALMREMDLVVSVCTSTASLAGALGCDTRVLLRRHADWRWSREFKWFDKAFVYQQVIPADWTLPLENLARDVSEDICRTTLYGAMK